jgi:aryl-alcohol dehydrogenase-like predicted oxidoreductase
MTMNYRQLGGSGARVSELCLGTMTFGEADEKSFMHKVGATEETSFQIMNRALELGCNFWDTADVYGQDGLSERVIGKWFKETGRRHDVVLATKCRFSMGKGPNDKGASRLHIKRAVDESLRRLQTEHIDLLQIHQQDFQAPEEEVVRALDELVQAGKVHYFGASNYAAYRLVESLWISDKRLLNRFVTLQAQYSLVERQLELEHVPAMKKFGVGLLPWSPLAGGFLSGKYQKNQPLPEGARLEVWKEKNKRWDNPRNWAIIDALTQVVKSLGGDVTVSQVALAWLLRKDTVSSVIFGARTVAQLEDNLKASAVKLSTEHMTRLDEASAMPLAYPYDFMKRNDGAW